MSSKAEAVDGLDAGQSHTRCGLESTFNSASLSIAVSQRTA
jgi:hypothetical protein